MLSFYIELLQLLCLHRTTINAIDDKTHGWCYHFQNMALLRLNVLAMEHGIQHSLSVVDQRQPVLTTVYSKTDMRGPFTFFDFPMFHRVSC
jgi:hypothetical protein